MSQSSHPETALTAPFWLLFMPHSCWKVQWKRYQPMDRIMISPNTWGPAARCRGQKRAILWLQWPKPLNFRLIGLGGHKPRSVAHVRFMRCSLRCCAGVEHAWGKYNGPRSRGIGYCGWQDLENPHRYTTFAAEPLKQQRDSTIIVLPRSRFTETWRQVSMRVAAWRLNHS